MVVVLQAIVRQALEFVAFSSLMMTMEAMSTATALTFKTQTSLPLSPLLAPIHTPSGNAVMVKINTHLKN